MELATIEMPRTEARKAFIDYRRAVRARHDAEDEQIMRGYRELARGSQLITLPDTIAAGGVDDEDLPRLAVMQADLDWCYLRRRCAGSVEFLPGDPQALAPNRRKGVYRLPVGTLPAHEQVPNKHGGTSCRWDGWGNWGRQHGEGVRAMVPKVPPALRPAHHLRNYAVLFEVPRWEPAPRPPGDPALLKHIGGDLYAVVAIWDLTPLEQAVLAGRSR